MFCSSAKFLIVNVNIYAFKSILNAGDCLDKSVQFSWQDFEKQFALGFFL